jgi:lysophospholipase L1-like esterase
MQLECFQRGAGTPAVKIGCVGDSITAGVHSSNRGTMAYPPQLQRLIDGKYGRGKYAVTNLGACGSTVLKKTASRGQPYWERPQYKTLVSNKWDVIVIMLGTNDANPNAWPVARGEGACERKRTPLLFSSC